jgi:hypothetical protein
MSQHMRVHPLTKDRIEELKTALERDAGVTATQEEIIGALVYGNTVAQLASVLPVYKRFAASAPKTDEPPPP